MSQTRSLLWRLSRYVGEEFALRNKPKNSGRGPWQAAMLMYKAHGPSAAVEAAARALAHRRRGDDAGFDIWCWICAAIQALEHRQAMDAVREDD